MPEQNRSLVVLPARGGSKRLPRKNVLDLAGKPLISHTIDAAIGCKCFSRILVTTDDEEIRSIAEAYAGVDVDHRSPELAFDTAKVAEVISEICSRPEIQANFDVICMMLPTAPFRHVEDIRSGFELLTPDIDAVVSFAPYDFPPQMAVTLDNSDSKMTPVFEQSPLITGNTRTQDQSTCYRPNGSFYISWVPSFLRHKSFFLGAVKGVTMTRLGSMDIDNLEDLQLARVVVKAGLSESDFV